MRGAWIFTTSPDNPMSINVDNITWVKKLEIGTGCMIRTSDGTDHTFHSVSYVDMMAQIRKVQNTDVPL